MNDVAIHVQNLGKHYRIGARQRRASSLRDAVAHTLASPFDYLIRSLRPPTEEEVIWALRDVSFSVRRGEVIGIVGRNGAGKSTLLKILSRITEPSGGYADINGRVGSLLEIGTGFHPELTGRENITMNGAMLGMSKAEIDRKLDEIVDFAGVDRFLDTPVKRYSSGMYVRLAFAVAAHLETEILLVDEVLAVGDAGFQKKCLGKMGDVAQEGRTVLFVSHNMGIIQRLCTRALLLDEGQLVMDGSTPRVVEQYLTATRRDASTGNDSIASLPRRSGFGELIRMTRCALVNATGEETDQLLFGEPFSVHIEAQPSTDLQDLNLYMGIDTALDLRVATVLSRDSQRLFAASASKPLCVRATFDNLRLTPGTYWLEIGIHGRGTTLDHLPRLMPFDVLDAAYADHPSYSGHWGTLYLTADWAALDGPQASAGQPAG